MKEILVFRCKIGILFLIVFAVTFTESFLLGRYGLPREQHAAFLRTVDKKFIVTGTGGDETPFLLNQSQLLLHTTIHSDYEEMDLCQNDPNQKCYIAASFISFFDADSPFKKCLCKGVLPSNESQLCINENIAEKLHLDIGDRLLVKSGSFIRTVQICGITRNFYGIDDFNADIFYAYSCLTFEDAEYLKNNRGKCFSFSDDDASVLTATRVLDDITDWQRTKYALFAVLLVLNVLLLLFAYASYARIQKLAQYYRRLFYLGVAKRTVAQKRALDAAFFCGLCLIGICIASCAASWLLVPLMQMLSVMLFFACCIRAKKSS